MKTKRSRLDFAASGAWVFAIACCVIVLAGFGGCASGPAWVTFKSTEPEQQFAQRFDLAVYSISPDGEYDLVLAEQSGPIGAATDAKLGAGQTLHIRMHAQPATRPGDAVPPSNATIDWFVTARGSRTDGLLHYRGTGSVTIDRGSESSRFVIHGGRLELTEIGLHLPDQPTESSLTGSFHAARDDSRVNAALAAIRAETMRTQPSEASAHEGPPPRGPTGP